MFREAISLQQYIQHTYNPSENVHVLASAQVFALLSFQAYSCSSDDKHLNGAKIGAINFIVFTIWILRIAISIAH